MAIYHCSCKVISRGQGRSAVGAAAYRSGEKLTNEYDGMTHDYSGKSGVAYSEIMLCENAPERYQNREILWNEVEQVEKSAKAQLAREYEVALPRELNREEQIQLVRDYVKENFVQKGMCADFSIHDKGDGNPHAHIMVTMRPIEKDGTWGAKQKKEYILDKHGNKQYDKKKQTYKCKTVKSTDWDSKEFLKNSREAWAGCINRELEKKNLPQRVDHRTLKEQGVDRVATIHEGVVARAMEKRGMKSDRGEVNREIKQANVELKAIKKEMSETAQSIGRIKEDMLWMKLHQSCAVIEQRIKQTAGDMTAQKQAIGHLGKLETLVAGTVERMKQMDYHAGKFYDMGEKGKVPYLDFHIQKIESDIAYLKERATQNISEIEKQKAQQPATPAKEQVPKPAQMETTRADLQREAAGAQDGPFDIDGVAKQLAAHRAAFVKAREQAEGRTFYQENPIYRQQAAQIADYAKAHTEQTASIQSLKAEQAKLGLFQGKRKKELQGKITNFERLRRENESKLKELGVSDPSKAEEAIKEKNAMAAQEKAKVQEARENAGASSRAEEAKAAYLALAQTVPEDMKQAVLAKMEQNRGKAERGTGGWAAYHAERAAAEQLDPAMKPKNVRREQKQQTQSRNGRDER